jgi:hypothetical protein
MLPSVRLSYPCLWTPKRFDETDVNSSRAWSSAFHLDKVKHASLIEELLAAEFAEVEAKMSDKEKPNARKLFDKLPDRDRRMLDGDETGAAEGCWVLNSRATEGKNAPPLILDRRRARVEEGGEGAPYAGCYVNAQVELWGQWNKYKRSNCTLLGVQFVKDGDAFGGGRPADPNAFADLGDQGEEDDELAGLA